MLELLKLKTVIEKVVCTEKYLNINRSWQGFQSKGEGFYGESSNKKSAKL